MGSGALCRAPVGPSLLVRGDMNDGCFILLCHTECAPGLAALFGCCMQSLQSSTRCQLVPEMCSLRMLLRLIHLCQMQQNSIFNAVSLLSTSAAPEYARFPACFFRLLGNTVSSEQWRVQ